LGYSLEKNTKELQQQRRENVRGGIVYRGQTRERIYKNETVEKGEKGAET